ncbi:MAG: RagB/SusD family nutrient uptake outer membrane protein [Bacteroidales bacterium]|nr:RagB/SusD family nutrient uptake outer membrane protein [Bacteroidales bacterium]
MKNYVIPMILSGCAMMLPFITNADTPVGNGTRIDYLDAQGERISSTSVEFNPGADPGVFSSMGTADRGYVFPDPNGSITPIRRMKFIPWGTESYPFKVENEVPDDIEVSYEIIGSDSQMRTRSSEDVSNVLCGSVIRVYTTIPEGTYPYIDFYQLYTNTDEEGTPLSQSLSGFSGILTNPYYQGGAIMCNPDWRKAMIEAKDQYGGFEKDANIANRWYIDVEMPNEPFTIEVSYIRPDNKLLRTVKNAALAELYSQDISFESLPFLNGEPYLMTMVGDYISEDLISGFIATGNIPASTYTDFSIFNHGNYWYNTLPWFLCYKWIYHANLVLSQLDRFTFADKRARDIAEAQMLTLRSHAYWRLLQMYAPRWSDSHNGEILCAPLETTFSTENPGAANMSTIIEQCIKDLDYALTKLPEYYIRENIIEPDLTVILGVKMRFALLREDWQMAYQVSQQLIQSGMIRLTTTSELLAGMFNWTGSWIWGAYNNYQLGLYPEFIINSLYYDSFQNWNACNGAYNALWKIGSNAISRDLFLCMSENDIRRELYVMPENMPEAYRSLSWWYNSNNIDPSSIFTLNLPNSVITRQPDYVSAPAFLDATFKEDVPIAYGAQTKFFQPGNSPFDDAAVVFMRYEEILLTHAEAAYRLGNNNEALADINTLNSARCSDYQPLTSAADIMDEIRKARKIELWGEGHSWFDQKRWNLPITRKHWEESDLTSGNWPSAFCTYNAVEDGNGWRFPIPSAYLKLNPNINISAFGYTNLEGYDTTTAAPVLNLNKISKIRVKQAVSKSAGLPLTIE